MIGETISADLELANSDNEILALSNLLHGADALIVLFCPYCFGENTNNSMEALVSDVNDKLEFFNQKELRVICITRYNLHNYLHTTNLQSCQVIYLIIQSFDTM